MRSTVALLALAVPVVAQTTWQVPGDVATIQGAIAAAADGDTIEIAPGTYAEALDSLGRSLTLVGTGGADVTIVDAGGLGASVLRLTTDEASAVHVQGLTLTGGSGTAASPSGSLRGGGVFASAGNHVLQDCILRHNGVAGPLSVGGGAWAGLDYPGGRITTGRLTLVGCELAFNSSGHSGGGAGGLVTLQDCHVHDNVAVKSGGGLYRVEAALGCLIEGNGAEIGGGVGFGGDALADCVLRANQAANYGGGLYDDDGFAVSLANVRFEGNSAGFNGGGASLASYNGGGPTFGITVDRCLFVGNDAPFGDGLFVAIGELVWPFGLYEISHCTFVGDQVFNPESDDVLVVRNGIFRGHAAPIVSTPADVSYSDVEGGFPGTGNLDADPLFVDAAGGDLALQPGSPCINTGDPGSDPDPDGSIADMGAIAYHPWTDLGLGLAGTPGDPVLGGAGPLTAGSDDALALTHALPDAPVALVVGFAALGAPFKGGVLVPQAHLLVPLVAGGGGTLDLPFTWPAGVPSATSLWLQAWVTDPGGPAGYAASNGLKATTP